MMICNIFSTVINSDGPNVSTISAMKPTAMKYSGPRSRERSRCTAAVLIFCPAARWHWLVRQVSAR